MEDVKSYNDGLDLERFWQEDDLAHENNCFNGGTRVALGIRMSPECILPELGIQGRHPWDELPPEEYTRLARLYNDRAEAIVGRRLLGETLLPHAARHPQVKRIGEAFGGKYVWSNHTEWLEQSVHSYAELEAVLDKVETMDFREFMLPPNWESEKKRIFEHYGLMPPLMRHIRGPVTLACSIMGAQELIFLIVDAPELARRFSAAIAHAILEMARVMDHEAGLCPKTRPGFSFADDNCCLLNPEMYELFGYPVLRRVFARYSPGPKDPRYQHSDSAMAHLLPILGRLDLTGVNFGPTVLAPEIRKALPHARIDGCINPLVFSRNESRELERQTLRDCEAGLACDGVNITTAGSINYGSSLESLRLIMRTIQQHGHH